MKEYSKEFIVEKKHLADITGSGSVPVLSTPSLLCFIENTCLNNMTCAIYSPENSEKTSVSVKCSLEHLHPVIEKKKIICHSIMSIENKNKFHFVVKVFCDDVLIAKCDHVRYLVPKDFYLYSHSQI